MGLIEKGKKILKRTRKNNAKLAADLKKAKQKTKSVKKPAKKKRTGPIPKTRPRAKPKINLMTGKPYVGPDRYKEMGDENKDPASVARRKRNKRIKSATKTFTDKMQRKLDDLRMLKKVAGEMNKAVPKKKKK